MQQQDKNMNYPLKIFSICNEVITQLGNHRIYTHPLIKKHKLEIYEATSQFPSKVSITDRIQAIASGDTCRCKQCGKIHGVYAKSFCSMLCYTAFRQENAPTPEEYSLKKTIERGEKLFADKIENQDYLICQICGAKSGDLGSHVHMHDITPKEYKKKFNIQYLKPLKNRDNRRGDKNPAFNHGGKYSPWSKNFVHGYDEDRHIQSKANHSAYMNDPDNRSKFQFFYEYWLDFANGDEVLASELYTKHQTKNLDFFIEKYGEDEGTSRHAAKTEKWLDTLANKSNEEMAQINSSKVRKSGSFSSKEERELLSIIQEYDNETIDQLCLWYLDEQMTRRFFLYDISLNKKIIEYNGDFWHANPKMYDHTFVNPYTHKTQAETHLRDKIKNQVAIDHGYEVLTVWETEYKLNKQKVITECIHFLKQ